VKKPMDRRSFLRNGAIGVAGVAVFPSLVAACADDSKPDASATTAAAAPDASATTAAATATTAAAAATPTTSATPADFGTLDYQLSWVKNAEFSGEYIADTSGYYSKVGFSKVNLISGGPSVAQDAVVQAGKAIVGISAPDITSSAINQGADLIAIGAQYQKNPFCVMSLASNPINTPQDMYGKKIGVQATNEAVWSAFIKASGLDASKINKVPVQFDPQGLVNKEVDGWFSFITNEPNVLKAKGIDTVTFLLNDAGYAMVSEIIIVKKATIASDREKLKAILKADIMGWRDSIKDPTEGPHLVVTNYGKDLGYEESEVVLESKAQNALIYTDDTKANGIFTLTDTLINETIKTLGIAGITITADKLFDLSLLKEVYAENPDLMGPVS